MVYQQDHLGYPSYTQFTPANSVDTLVKAECVPVSLTLSMKYTRDYPSLLRSMA